MAVRAQTGKSVNVRLHTTISMGLDVSVFVRANISTHLVRCFWSLFPFQVTMHRYSPPPLVLVGVQMAVSQVETLIGEVEEGLAVAKADFLHTV